MIQISRISGLFALLIIGGFIIIFVSTWIISSNTLASADAVPIYAGIIGFFATIISTIYKEFSERYAEKRAQEHKRWELVFPILRDSYVPWINSAKKLHTKLKQDNLDVDSELNLNRILYFICLFYGIRLRFILKHGGLFLLGTKKEEEDVQQAYDKIKDSFQWAGIETPIRVSELQDYFMRNNKENDPVVFKNFSDELNGEILTSLLTPLGTPSCIHQTKYNFKESREKLQSWLKENPNNVQGVVTTLNNFIDIFDNAVSRLSGRE